MRPCAGRRETSPAVPREAKNLVHTYVVTSLFADGYIGSGVPWGRGDAFNITIRTVKLGFFLSNRGLLRELPFGHAIGFEFFRRAACFVGALSIFPMRLEAGPRARFLSRWVGEAASCGPSSRRFTVLNVERAVLSFLRPAEDFFDRTVGVFCLRFADFTDFAGFVLFLGATLCLLRGFFLHCSSSVSAALFTAV